MIQYRDLLGDTICAPVTPPGHSGVAVIRVSGDKAFNKTLSIIENRKLKPESHRSYLSTIIDDEKQKIDQVLLTFFAKGQSFTGDETVEVSCHGNPLLVNAIINRFLDSGCRSAERGEFSFRAYYNGKIDLVQAESIHSLVTTKVKLGSRTFVDQLKGQLSKEFESLQDDIVTAMAHLEASIDFVEENIETSNLEAVGGYIGNALNQVIKLLKTYDLGKSLQKDLKVLILGQTNAGKSSLFNYCLGSERAIVTEVAGTTRDLVSGQSFLGSSSIEFVDSAGIRKTEDLVENIGIQKSLGEINVADLIFYVVDLTNFEGQEILPALPSEKVILVLNKLDLLTDKNEAQEVFKKLMKQSGLDFPESRVCFVSSRTGVGIDDLLAKAERVLVDQSSVLDGEIVVTQARHFTHLSRFKDHMEQAQTLIFQQESPDLISQELALGLSEIHQLLGKEYDDEVLDKIFSSFCIGK